MKTITSFKVFLTILFIGSLFTFSQSTVVIAETSVCEPQKSCLKSYFKIFQVFRENMTQEEWTTLVHVRPEAKVNCRDENQLNIYQATNNNGAKTEIGTPILQNTSNKQKIVLLEEGWNGAFQEENRLVESGSSTNYRRHFENGYYFYCSQVWDGKGAVNEGNENLYIFSGVFKVAVNNPPDIGSDPHLAAPEGKQIIEKNGIDLLNHTTLNINVRVRDIDALK